MAEESNVEEMDLDRLSELANIGAGHAASAFATLTGRTILMGVPRIKDIDANAPVGAPANRDDAWSTGVFFEFEGCLDAIVGILFHEHASEVVVRRVVGIEEDALPAHCIESALMEVGNILASHVASAIADTLGERLLPSIPTLAMNEAEQQLGELVAQSKGNHPFGIECELTEPDGELGGMLVLIPHEP
jgi:chemotaxis protein CheC